MLLTEKVTMKWNARTKRHYEEKGYIFTNFGDRFDVKVGDLSSGSSLLVEYECSGCRETMKIGWRDYRKCTKKDESHYCQKCSRAGFIKWVSFYDWCHDNLSDKEADEIILRWDNDMNVDNLGNKITPKDISHGSYKTYWFKCLEHVDHMPEQKRIHDFTSNGQTGSIKCNLCKTISVTHPHFIKYLVNKEDALRCSIGSHKQIPVKCPNCGYEKSMDIHILARSGFGCTKCSDGFSYPEKFILNVLEQIGVSFRPQLSKTMFSWCKNYLYDFYLDNTNCIIETHGSQHYEDVRGGNWGTLSEIHDNDNHKEQVARKNGINNYIILDCRYSNIDFIKNGILKSVLPKLLGFKESDINWLKCHGSACSSMVKQTCDLWNDGTENTSKIAEKLGVSRGTVIRYLKQGAMSGWCDYSPGDQMKKVYTLMRATPAINRRKAICLTTGEVFSSQYDASKKYGAWDVSKCCKGKRSHSGFHPETGEKLEWAYCED